MSTAKKCDRCNEFFEPKPDTIVLEIHKVTKVEGDTEHLDSWSADFCPECSEAFAAFAKFA